jgi:hypothetical protein
LQRLAVDAELRTRPGVLPFCRGAAIRHHRMVEATQSLYETGCR